MIKLNARELRSYQSSAVSHQTIKRNEIYIILDNVLDAYNIGSIFRLADAVAAKKIYLCGQTETPPNHRIKKASINTTEWVTWSYRESAVEAIKELRQQFANRLPTTDYRKAEDGRRKTESIQVIAIEQSTKSVQYNTFDYKLPICLVVGHETHGVSKEVLKMADGIVEIPMFGVNKSLNVMVSLGIVLYKVVSKIKQLD
ncbi:hypothetical protein HYU96_04770 [Candidatus Daviesbacteria bacterium]|nr:hypothetical protein [Candidatus Daviesbacteria bacterium]